MVTVSWQTLVTIAAVLTALSTVFGRYNKVYDFIKRQEEQDKQIKEIQAEQTILIEGILACLKWPGHRGYCQDRTTPYSEISWRIRRWRLIGRES